MEKFNQYHHKIIKETESLQIIDINISGAGTSVNLDIETFSYMDAVIGIGIINPTPTTSGHGTIQLKIGDTEILPNGFHVDLISKYNHRFVDTRLEFGFKNYIFPVKAKAGGKPVKIYYTEPTQGGTGKLHLYLLCKKDNVGISIPFYRFQPIEIPVPIGDNEDIEILINEKTQGSHKKVVGCMLLAPTNRVKQVKLSIDNTTVFPEGMPALQVSKELVNAESITGGILTRHLTPFSYIMFPCNIKAENSKIEGSVIATSNSVQEYKIFLYLLTIS